jgi:uncharacterized delta-60 repeat protein
VTGPNNAVNALALQPDGNLLLGGHFTQIDGQPWTRLARRLPSGAADPTFNPGSGPNSEVRVILLQPDGRILVGGIFTLFNGTGHNRLVRLTPQGLTDPSLSIGTAANNSVEALAVQADGKILVGGSFTQFAGNPHNRLVRLLPEGTVDPAFAIGVGANNTVRALWAQTNDRVVVGGDFTQINELDRPRLARLLTATSAPGGALGFAQPWFEILEGTGTATIEVVRLGSSTQAVQVDYSTANGTATVADYLPATGTLSFAAGQTTATFTVTVLEDALAENDETVLLSLSNPTGGAELGSQRNSVLVILNDDYPTGQGMVDWGYSWLGANGAVLCLAPASEGRLLVGGDFSLLAGVNRNRIARLLADGTPDPTFHPSAYTDNSIEAVAVQPDGKVLIGGSFTQVNGITRNRLARLNADGTLDLTFDPGAGFNNTVRAVAIQSDGRILAGGHFTHYQGVHQPYLVRLLTDATLDASYAIGTGPNNAVNALALQPDGNLLLGGHFTQIDGQPWTRLARRLPSGAADPTFNPGSGPNSEVRVILLQPDGRILVGGIFTLFNGTGHNRLVRLTPQGLTDPSLSIGTAANNSVEALAVQADGKILVGGSFTQFAGNPHNRLVRLLPEGTVDPAFAIGVGANNTVRALWAQTNDRVVVGGDFTQINELDRPRLARLLTATSAPGGALGFAQPWFEILEGTGTATIEVVRLGSSTQAVQVDYSTANGTATVADYLPATGTLSFAAGQTTATFTVTVLEDALAENDETVLLSLSNPTGGAELGSQRNSVLVILNDDYPTGQGMVDWGYSWLGANGAVLCLAPASEGRLLVGGDFSLLAGVNRNRIARLLADGTPDPTFHPSAYTDNSIEAVAVQPDGKVLIGGSFTQVNGITRNRLARLNADGTLDLTFDPGAGFNNTVRAVAIQSDGRILVGGHFTHYQGVHQPYLVRLLTDATLDASYAIGTGPNNAVNALALQPDGRLLLGGHFTQIDGQPWTRLARRLSSGAADSSFTPGVGANAEVRVILLQPDGHILVGGSFTQFVGATHNRLVRLTAEGLPDISLSIGTGANNSVEALAVQADGKILVGGSFTQFAGNPHNRLVRLLPEGAVDPAFAIGVGANNTVRALWVEPEGNLVVGGDFTLFDNFERPRLVRLVIDQSEPPIPLAFLFITTTPEGIELTLTGPLGRDYVIEATTDFQTWDPVANGTISNSPFAVWLEHSGVSAQFFRAVSNP